MSPWDKSWLAKSPAPNCPILQVWNVISVSVLPIHSFKNRLPLTAQFSRCEMWSLCVLLHSFKNRLPLLPNSQGVKCDLCVCVLLHSFKNSAGIISWVSRPPRPPYPFTYCTITKISFKIYNKKNIWHK